MGVSSLVREESDITRQINRAALVKDLCLGFSMVASVILGYLGIILAMPIRDWVFPYPFEHPVAIALVVLSFFGFWVGSGFLMYYFFTWIIFKKIIEIQDERIERGVRQLELPLLFWAETVNTKNG